MNSRFLIARIRAFWAVALLCVAGQTESEAKTILLIAGKQSHGPGDHEFRAGSLLLEKGLATVPGVHVLVASNGWPADESIFDRVDAVLIYADGGGGHPAIQGERMKQMDALAARGVGLGFAHYGVEVPAGDPGAAMHRWVGGYYEHQFSVNPMWNPDFTTLPDHPVTRGVKPFHVNDEWYFNMRWVPGLKNVTPILVATPGDAVRKGPYVYPKGPYEHIVAASGRPETMMWVFERPGGGRGMGFTGGHRHVNWGNEDFRKVVLNGLLWLAHVEVPSHGVEVSFSPEDLRRDLDPKPKKLL